MQSLFSVTNNVSLISITVTPGAFLAVVALLLCFLTLYIPIVPHIRLPRVSLPSVSLPRNLLQQPPNKIESAARSLTRYGYTNPSSDSSSPSRIAAATASSRRQKLLLSQKALPALPAAPLPPPSRSSRRGWVLPAAVAAPASLIEQITPSRQLALPEFISSYWRASASAAGRASVKTDAPLSIPALLPKQHGTHTTPTIANNNKKHYNYNDDDTAKGRLASSSSSSAATRRSLRRARSPGRIPSGLRAANEPHDGSDFPHLDPPLLSGAQRSHDRRDGRDPRESRRGIGRGFRRWWLLTTGVAETRQRRPQQRLLESAA